MEHLEPQDFSTQDPQPRLALTFHTQHVSRLLPSGQASSTMLSINVTSLRQVHAATPHAAAVDMIASNKSAMTLTSASFLSPRRGISQNKKNKWAIHSISCLMLTRNPRTCSSPCASAHTDAVAEKVREKWCWPFHTGLKS